MAGPLHDPTCKPRFAVARIGRTMRLEPGVNGLMNLSEPNPVRARTLAPIVPFPWPSCVVVLVVMTWVYWPTLARLFHKWCHDPQYSHGFLVPLFAGYLLWLRADKLQPTRFPVAILGLMLLAAALLLRGYAGFFGYLWLGELSLLPALAGVVLTFGGLEKLRWAWPAIAFLFFMIPLPYRLEVALGAHLQTVATQGSTFLLQTLGQPAIAEGNTILLHDVRLGIVEACSGLRMLMTFFAFSTGVAMLVNRPLLERLFIVASAVPIALLTNVLRITFTGLAHVYINGHTANLFFHDLAGWVMMPVCLALLWLELQLLQRMFVEVETAPPTLAGGFGPKLSPRAG